MLLAELSDGLTLCVWIAVGLFALVYVGAPLLIYSTQRFEAEPTLEPFEPGEVDWPEEVERLFAGSEAALAREGFDVVAGMFLPSAVPNVKTALILFVHRVNRDSAMATAIFGMPMHAGSPRTLYLEFTTRFRDGTVFNTHNTKELGSFPPEPRTTTSSLPTVTDPHRLYRIHKKIIGEHGVVSRAIVRLDEQYGGDAARFLHAIMRESYEKAADAGYVRLASAGTHFRPTIRGAFLMVWKELWPWKPLRRAVRNRRERELLDRLSRPGDPA